MVGDMGYRVEDMKVEWGRKGVRENVWVKGGVRCFEVGGREMMGVSRKSEEMRIRGRWGRVLNGCRGLWKEKGRMRGKFCLEGKEEEERMI